jgi:hypothetical protein
MNQKAGCLSLQNITKAKEELLKLKDKGKFEKMIEAAAIITEVMEQEKLKPIIVGGLSVEIYTLQEYTTHDIDFVLSGYEKANEILLSLGFEKEGRYWIHPEIGLSIEIPDHVLAGDYDKVTTFPIGKRKVYVIGIEDIILDRLRAAVNWRSGVDREWGFRLLYTYFPKIDVDYLYANVETPSEMRELKLWIEKIQKNEENEGSI